MLAAMPFLVKRGTDDNGTGTAFLVTKSNRIFLLTCAHTAEGTQPTLQFHQWPSSYWLRVKGDWQEFSFFDADRAPMFRYRLRPDGSMADMLAFELPEKLHKLLSEEFRVYPLDMPYTCSKGDKLAAYGYPDVDANVWPPSLQKSLGKAIDETVLANIPTQLGFSGGPVVIYGAFVAGMLLGTDDHKRTVVMRAAVLAELLE